MIRPDAALRDLIEATRVNEVVEVSLDACYRLVLAEDVSADRDFPPTDRSAMDGFAVRAADVQAPGVVLELAGEVRAGQPADRAHVGAGQAVRIYTGAVMPPGADAVVMVEHTEEDREAGTVRVNGTSEPGRHVRPRGSEMRRGETVAAAGQPIHAAEIAALASTGSTRVRVHRPPLVNVLSTGDEVVEPGRRPEAYQVRNSNAGMLLALLRDVGLPGIFLGNASDSESELAEKLAQGIRGDVLLVTGGVSVGEYDLVGRALADAGLELLFHKVAMKPGKPILAGKAGDCLVIGLPGNPVSVFTGFSVFVAPVLRRTMGYRQWDNRHVQAEVERAFRCRPGRLTYHPARVVWQDGHYVAQRVDSTGSGDVLSLARANAFLITTEETAEVRAGDELAALLWDDADRR